jgi:hypothetical protein
VDDHEPTNFTEPKRTFEKELTTDQRKAAIFGVSRGSLLEQFDRLRAQPCKHNAKSEFRHEVKHAPI